MKNIFVLVTLIAFNYTSSAQNSLQESLNKALKETETNNSLINFEAHFDGSIEAVQLKWVKPTDKKIATYVIEKSSDKSTWQEFAQINGMDHHSQAVEYFQTDNQPLAGISYYRIKQQDGEGKELLSNIVPVKVVMEETKITNLFPLEEDNKTINISFDNLKDEDQLLVVLRDTKGTEYYSKVFVNTEDDAMVAIPVDNTIPKGDYLIIASSEDQMYSQNISIQ